MRVVVDVDVVVAVCVVVDGIDDDVCVAVVGGVVVSVLCVADVDDGCDADVTDGGVAVLLLFVLLLLLLRLLVMNVLCVCEVCGT